MAAMVVVNGPIRHEIGMNSGTGAMAPYNHANATIGRAYGLLSQNLQGGSLPGDSYMGSQGNGYAYGTVTFAENEERSPWTPFHVQHGFKPTDSTVSIFTGCRSTAFTLGVRETILARTRAQHAARHGRAQRADFSARSDCSPAVYRPRRLRHQGKTHPVGLRERADAGGRVLGLSAHSELYLPAERLSAKNPTRRNSKPRRTK